MKIIIHNNSMIPIYEQIVDKIKTQILDNTLKEGEGLPSVRTLARDLKISALTVKKAYDQLDREGFITTIHGKGSFVLSVNPEAKREDLLYKTQLELEKIIKKARNSGIKNTELISLITMIIEEE